jgi:hypothetical protein
MIITIQTTSRKSNGVQQPVRRVEDRRPEEEQKNGIDEQEPSAFDSPDHSREREPGGGPEQTQNDFQESIVTIDELHRLGERENDEEEQHEPTEGTQCHNISDTSRRITERHQDLQE